MLKPVHRCLGECRCRTLRLLRQAQPVLAAPADCNWRGRVRRALLILAVGKILHERSDCARICQCPEFLRDERGIKRPRFRGELGHECGPTRNIAGDGG